MNIFSQTKKILPLLLVVTLPSFQTPGLLRTARGPSIASPWESKLLHIDRDGRLQYLPDDKGNILPDFSRVGYEQGDRPMPEPPVVTTVSPSDNAQQAIQSAIDELSKRTPDAGGLRGVILLKKGVYNIPGTLYIRAGGIVLRGEGDETKLVATGKGQRSLIEVSGSGSMAEDAGSRTSILGDHVPAGAQSFQVQHAEGLKPGDSIIVFRPGTDAWIRDLKMDAIEEREGTKQWQAREFDFLFERVITSIQGNTIYIDNPIVMALEKKYGGGEIFKYHFEGRIAQVGIERLYCQSEYAGDTDEDHGWDAIVFNKVENGWVRDVTARYFGYSCVNLGSLSRNISVIRCNCFDAKSQITGGRRYSFCNTGQMNFFTDCHATEGRHDYVTGARVCGPNVFYHCFAERTHADIGPHHRWAMGTLYDNIVTDGEINIQDRGNWGSGHGWSGVEQVLWNCTAKRAAVQSPWVSGLNYCIGLKGDKYEGRLKGRPDGEWEGENKDGLQPASLYMAQLKARQDRKSLDAAAQAQSSPAMDAGALVRKVADHIIQTTSFRFINSKTGAAFPSLKDVASSPDIKAENKFNKWAYVNGVLTVGMVQMAAVLKDPKYSDYSRKNFDFIFSNLDFFKKQFDAGAKGVEYRPVFKIGSLDDCGAMAAGLLDVYAFDKRKDYMDYLLRVGDYILNQQLKLPDGTLSRNHPHDMTLWADDLYMSVPFLARMGKLTGDRRYFDFAIRQVENFNRYLYDSTTGLYFHCYYSDEAMNGVGRWGRCNGWLALAQTALLNDLPADHPKRAELTRLLLRQIKGFSRYQDISGCWRQVLDRPDSYLESSVTAMFVYTVAHAVNQGWIDKSYITIAQNGWEGLARKVTPEGELQDVCIGTNIAEDIRFYYDRPRETNDTHGLGAFLLAGTEIVLAKDKLVDLTKKR